MIKINNLLSKSMKKFTTLAVFFVIALFTLSSHVAMADTWSPTGAPTGYWSGIASDSTGTKLVAVQQQNIAVSVSLAGHVYTTVPGHIYTSTDGGSTWMVTSAPGSPWTGVASDATGTKLAAVQNIIDTPTNGIYVSTDGGVTWTRTTAPIGDWTSIASDSTGMKLVAVEDGDTTNGPGYTGRIYTSINGGVTWTQTSAPKGAWARVASDSTGMKLVAGQYYSGHIYTSTDGGVTWTLTSAPVGEVGGISCDSTGMKLAIELGSGVTHAVIYTSTDGGVTWTLRSSPGTWSKNSIASDSTGMNLAVSGTGGGYIDTSTDGGMTLNSTSAPSGEWTSIVSLGGAGFAATQANNGGIWKNISATSSTANTIKITTNHSSLAVSKNLAFGQTDPQIIILQQYLISHGYLSGSATGFYGGMTKGAVKKLQADLGITSNGATVGPATRAALANIK